MRVIYAHLSIYDKLDDTKTILHLQVTITLIIKKKPGLNIRHLEDAPG